MSESKRKAVTEVTVFVGIKHRVGIASLLKAQGQCAKCGAGPFPTGDPQKFARAMALTEALRLDEIEDLDMGAGLAEAIERESVEALVEQRRAGIKATLKTDVLRSLLNDTILTRSWMLPMGSVPFRTLLDQLLPLAKDCGIKVHTLDDSEEEGLDEVAPLVLTPKQRALLIQMYRSPQPCSNPMQMGGTVVIHGTPTDNPRKLADALDANRTFELLGLGSLETDEALVAAINDNTTEDTWVLDKRSLTWLKATLVRRTETVGLSRLATIITKVTAALAAAKSPEDTSEPASAVLEKPALDERVSAAAS